MQWNDHSRLVGQHAFLGASKYHWLNYDTQRLVDAFMSCQANIYKKLKIEIKDDTGYAQSA